MALTIDSTTPTIDTTLVTIDRAPLSTIAVTSIAFSASLQAPITLSNPTASLIFASDSGSGVHQANPIPLQGAINLIGAAVRMALAMSTNAGAAVFSGSGPTVISGIVTPRTPAIGALSVGGSSPTISTPAGGFIPQPGYSYSGTIADGSTFTITKSGGGLGVKPIDPRPLLFMDPANNGLIPSPLGRTTTINNVNNLSVISTGGPAGGSFVKGAPVVSGDSGTQKTWTAAADVDQWGAGSPAFNAYGTKYRLWRTKYQNFGRADESPVASGGQNANIKILRLWGRLPPNVVGSAQGYPDWYMSISNCLLTAESCSNAHLPDFPRPNQGAGTTDQKAIDNCTAFYGGPYGGTPNPVTNSNWFSERFIIQANQNDPGSSPPTPDSTSMLFKWMVEGLNSNNPAFATPVQTYQWNQWYIRSAVTASLSTAANTGGATSDGNIYRCFFWHDIVDGTSGRFMLPVGSYPGYGATILDDSWCAVEIRDNANVSAFTKNEQQPTSAWSDTSVSFVLRKGRFTSYSGTKLIITDNAGVEHYAGDFS